MVSEQVFKYLDVGLDVAALLVRQGFADIQAQLEQRLQQWMQETNDPFEWGERDEVKGMLKLGQVFTDERWNHHRAWLSRVDATPMLCGGHCAEGGKKATGKNELTPKS